MKLINPPTYGKLIITHKIIPETINIPKVPAKPLIFNFVHKYLLAVITKIEFATTKVRIYKAKRHSEKLAVNCNKISIIHETGIATKVSNPIPNTFKDCLPT